MERGKAGQRNQRGDADTLRACVRINQREERFMSKIVVVDDSVAEQQLIESYLKAAHHTVVICPNTDHLEDKIIAEKPDLIVMDVVMPGRNGFQACRDLKSDDRFKGIPIILCTSKGNESDKFWGQQQGANAHVVKPFKSDDLLQVVKRLLH
jgi:twitching motility two-component system response regulator PilH